MIAPARQAAFEVLLTIGQPGAHLPTALANARQALRERRDHALLTELVTGTVRMRAALDYQISLRVSRPLARLDAAVHASLRLGAFQLIYLTRTPPSAVVNDAVALTRRAGKSSAAGMVNAVLRALSRDRDALAWPEGPLAESLAVRESHPVWLVHRWLARYGEEATTAWLRFNNAAPRLTLAVNVRRGTREELQRDLASEGVTTEPTDRAPGGLLVVQGSALSTEAFRTGRFVVQDEASQLVAGLGSLPVGGTVLDLCAAPGGKTLILAARAGLKGRVVACDVRPRRVRLLQSTLARCGATEVNVVQVPSSRALPFRSAVFDFVLVDAPCSGLGTLRRDPDIRWSREEADLVPLAASQLVLLTRASDLVRPGGTLVYATCSSEPEENENVARAFLSDRKDMSLQLEHRTLPFRDRLEAFYAAVITRNV